MTPQKSVPPSGCICGVVDCKVPYGICHCGCGGTTNLIRFTQAKRGLYEGLPYRFILGHSHSQKYKGIIRLGACICGQSDCGIEQGYCHCGCGGRTKIPTRNSIARLEHRGVPLRFIHGHHQTHERPDMSDVGHFKIDGVYCRLIALTQGLYAVVWESDFEELNKDRWFASWDQNVKGYYAQRNTKIDGKYTQIPMHRQILGLSPGDPREGDHKDPMCTLDNRRDNLRIANREEQMRNRRINKRNTSGYKEVSLTPGGKSYRARISIDGVRVHLGVRKTAKEAHDELFVPAALKYYGEFARFK